MVGRRYMGLSAGLPVVKYGYLYNYYVIEGTGNASIIPLAMSNVGWSVPQGAVANRDTTTLVNYDAGGQSNIGARLKEDGVIYWEGNVGALNIYNLNFRGSGFRQNGDGVFSSLRYQFRMWEYYAAQTYYFMIYNNGANGGFGDATGGKSMGLAIRLVRAATVNEQLQIDGSACDPYIGNDGLQYPTVKIGTQVWLGCNLAETKYRGGTDITYISDNATWGTANFGARCAYNNDMNNVFISSYQYNFVQKTMKYGYLYNWYATQGSGTNSITSSDDWTVPLLADFNYLLTNFAPLSRMKSTNSDYWLPPNSNAVNLFSMEIRAGGMRLDDGSFSYLKAYGLFQIKDYVFSTDYVKVLNFSNVAETYIAPSNVKYGCSIRLVRPATVSEQLQADGTPCASYIGNDTQVYPTVKIGTQVWLVWNLAETKLRSGLPIPNVPNDSNWIGLASIGRCAYNNDINNVFI
jgi:uncharacterized protein (TIGR02145 family)